MGKKIIVFGVTGEIGGRIAKFAVESGYEVIGVSRGTNRRPVVDLTGVTMLTGDKGDPEFIKNSCMNINADIVIDSVPQIEHIELFYKYFKQVENFLFCSSVGTYAPLQYMPADETHSWRQKTSLNFYNQSVRDIRIMELYEQGDFPATILRPTEILGAGRIPIELWGARNIEFFRLLKANKPVTIADCENILIHPVHNQDVAGAFISALKQPEVIRGEIYNIAGKYAVTLARYLEIAKEYLNSNSAVMIQSSEEMLKMPYVSDKDFTFLMTHNCIDITKARDTFNYNPVPVEESLVEALKWCESVNLL
jgi:nucleoside-diphosphate-sugar epimerase